MNLHTDFNSKIVVHSPQIEWQNSPMGGVLRRTLEHSGNESAARATTIVKFEPNSKFSPHVHNGGEEFIVLEGVFQDEHKDYPSGSYVRNPPQSSHTPGSKQGCTIFVKLWQFELTDRTHLHLDMNSITRLPDESRMGVQASTLFKNENETVHLEHWNADTQITVDTTNGAEILVLEGNFCENGDQLNALSWMRIPMGASFNAITGSNGAKVWIKTGHLRFATNEINQVAKFSP